MNRLVPICSQKGGVGKTTVAMALASIAAQDCNVLVVDADPQQSATWWSERAGERLPFTFAASTDPGELRELRGQGFDLIIVDTPGSLDNGPVFDAVLSQADFVVLPTEPAALAVQPLLTSIHEVVAPREIPFKVLINGVGNTPADRLDAEEAEEMLREANIPLFRTHIRRWRKHKTAPLAGDVATTWPRSADGKRAEAEIREVATELFAGWSFPRTIDLSATDEKAVTK